MTSAGEAPAAIVVIAVGNRFGSDDGVAAAVLDAAAPRLPAAIETREVDGEATRLLDAWEGAGAAVVVDAVRSGRDAGTLHRLVVTGASGEVHDWPARPSGASTHAAGLADALALGGALDRLPAHVVLFAVEGVDFSPGDRLTPEVAAAVPAAVDAVVAEVERLARRARATGSVR